MDPPHLYTRIDLGPGRPPFELRPSPGKGWGAFATRRLSPGDLIFKEQPVFVIHKAIDEITEYDFLREVLMLSPHYLNQVRCLPDKTSLESGDHMELFKFRQNEFMVSADPPAHGLFVVLSRFNHSCIPNCRIPSGAAETDQLEIRAAKSIVAGQELTFCYNPVFQFLTTEERAKLLYFPCKCGACKVGTPFNQISNMRRTLVRGLYYLTHGKDPERLIPPLARPHLTDPALMKTAEALAIPLSTRFIAVLLMAFLLEGEGLMDPSMAAALRPNMQRLAGTFRTTGNVQIAAAVMREESWMGRFCVAFGLYGKEDDADKELVAALQEARRGGFV